MKENDGPAESAVLLQFFGHRLQRENSKRPVIASALARAFPGGVTLRHLADVGKREGKSYAGLIEAFAPSGNARLIKGARSTFRELFDEIDHILERAPATVAGLKVIHETPLTPETMIRLGRHSESPLDSFLRKRGLARETSITFQEGGVEVPCPVSPFHVSVMQGTKLYLSISRVGTRCRIEDGDITPLRLNKGLAFFSPKYKDVFDSAGDLTAGRASFVSQETKSRKELFDGWLWGCDSLELQQRYRGSKTLRIDVVRISYRDHLEATTKANAEALAARWWAKRNQTALFPLQNVLQVCVLLTIRGRHDEVFAILTLRHNFIEKDPKVGYWTASGTGHCISERLADDDRPPGPAIQAERIVRRQIGIEISASSLRWTGVAVGEDHAVTLFCHVPIEGTARDVVDLFGRRSMRHDAKRIALVSRTKIRRALCAQSEPNASLHTATLTQQLPKLLEKDLGLWPSKNPTGECHPALSTALALWLRSTGQTKRGKLAKSHLHAPVA